MRFLLFFPLASLFLLACPDAQPGDPKGGGGGSTSAGNGSGGDNAGAGNVGGAPDFSSATPTMVSAPEEDFGNQFGYTVAVSGETVAVGAYGEWFDLQNAGGVYVYTQAGSTFEEQAVLHAQPSIDGSFFGYAVSISGDVLWTTAPAYSETINLGGAAYVLTRGGDSWLSQAMVEADEPQDVGNFGRSVAVSGKTAVVGAPQVGEEGRAFLFEESGGEWSPAGQLVPDEAIWDYGAGVAIDGDTILVGSRAVDGDPRTVFVFARDGSTWSQEDKLQPGNGGVGFGTSVSLSGNIAVVGSSMGQASRAYVFVRSGTSWSQEAELSADDGEDDDRFGVSVAVSGNLVIVGAPYNDEAGSDRGAAYVFAREGGEWSLQTKLLETHSDDDAHFGTSVAVGGKIAVVGAVNDVTGEGRATIYLAPESSGP